MADHWRWSIVYVYLDSVVGGDQSGNRPVLIISEETFNQHMDVVTVLPLTKRKPGRTIYLNEVALVPEISGLPDESVVLAHQIRTISKDRIKRRVQQITDEEIREGCLRALRIHLGMF